MGRVRILALGAVGILSCGLLAAQPSTLENPGVPAMLGDRDLAIIQVYPPEAFYHNGKGGRVLDVTQPPFHAKGDGTTDDTQALNAAMRFVRDHYELIHGPDFAYCEKRNNRNWVIYLPDGVYLVGDTICQGWPAQAINILKGWSHIQLVEVQSPEHETELNANGARQVYSETNWAIRIVGQSRDRTVVRLRDAAPGFAAAGKAVVSFYMLSQGSNVNNGNVIENITIDTGKGNPGAVGLAWSASNYGGIRNLAIRSGDGAGQAGLLMDRRNATGYVHDLLVAGFDTGIELTAKAETSVTLEYATLSGQRKTGIRVGGGAPGRNSLSARQIVVTGAPVALAVDHAAQVVLLDSRLAAAGDGAAAMVLETQGQLYARNVATPGFRAAVTQDGKAVVAGTTMDEYCSTRPVGLHGDAPMRSMRLPVKEVPFIRPETNLSEWANVDAFGAVGDGVADDTAAIQQAMDSGKPVVYFPQANYVVNGTVCIPASVREVSWLFGGVHRSVEAVADSPALFRVAAPSAAPVLLHGAITAGGVFLDHEADRPVVLEDIEVWFHHVREYARGPGMLFPSGAAQTTPVWRLYRNTRPQGETKEVYVNNCLFFAADGKEGKCALENVRAWARMVNSEHLPGAQYSFRHSDAWILGFKSENADRLFSAVDQTRLEVLGGSFLNWSHMAGPMIVSRDSDVSFLCYLWSQLPATIVREETGGEVKTVPASQCERIGSAKGAVVAISAEQE